MMLSASEVLDKHRTLADLLVNDRMFYEYLDGFMYSVWDKSYKQGGWNEVAATFGSMFHPANDPAQFRALLHKDLFDARTFQVTREMVEAVTGTWKNSKGTVQRIEEEGLPSPCGFIWLDEPVYFADQNGKSVCYRAISWGPQAVTYVDRHIVPGVRITAWSSTKDRDEFWTDEEAELWEKGKFASIDVLFAHANTVPYGARIQSRDVDAPATRDDFLTWLRVLWAFMDTEIVVTAKHQVSRPFMRRAARALGRPDVNVVSLRRTVVSSDPDREPEHREIDWSNRWVVSGHHRHIGEYQGEKHHAVPDPANANKTCATCGGRITWVHAYVKGPEGLPLRSVEQLYRLHR